MASLGFPAGAPRRLDDRVNFAAVARPVDIIGYLECCAEIVRASGGHVVLAAEPERLRRTDAGRVRGIDARDRDGQAAVDASWAVLAGGGFQSDAALRVELLGAPAAELGMRSNPNSNGAGLRLARGAGAAIGPDTTYFYGNLWPAGAATRIAEADFANLSQYHSVYGLLLDRTGRRVDDESSSYYENAHLAMRHGPLMLVGDQRVRELGASFSDPLDRVERAAAAGYRVATATSLSDLDTACTRLGFHHVGAAVRRFNAAVERSPEQLDPPRRRHRRALASPPYFALEVEPAITFPFAGVRIDDRARVLDMAGVPIPGLLAAGADAHVYHRAYGGGLAFALVSGLAAGATITARARW